MSDMSRLLWAAAAVIDVQRKTVNDWFRAWEWACRGLSARCLELEEVRRRS